MDKSSLRETAVALNLGLTKLSRRLRAERRERQTSLGKLSVLGRLYHNGSATPGSLASAEGLQPQSLTRLLAELEADGYVLRRQDTQDRRQYRIEITAAGREILYRFASDRTAWLAAGIESQFSPVERDLLRLAAQLLNRLADMPMNESQTEAAA